MIREYSVKRDGDGRVSKHFRVWEFASKDGADKVLIDDDLLTLLEAIRSEAGDKAITINSAYRTQAHNQAVGGVWNSQHVQGKAADIVVEGTDPLTVGQIAEYILGNRGGIGVYQTFTHVDTRANKSRWDQRSGYQVVVSGWPGYKEDDMDISKLTDEQILELANRLTEVLGKQPPSDWSEDARQWAEADGYIKGDENGDKQYKAWVTREQMAVFMQRLAKRL